MTISRDLPCHSVEADAVVVADGALETFAQDVAERATSRADEGAAFFHGRLHELGVERRRIDFGQVAVGTRPVGDPVSATYFL
ncbi:MAG: hypothetical protein JNK99_07270 [Candidatus Accumulibacter sp.]|uniref:hypothetical protein n=1 Tax=Accumulibacter sp. TaxID=2053492 RepID=UPI001A5398B5|nr:hypothetical protein [Accumulibacter sp.]MBL8394539.1 hypothetical protein [Accumulibacter sp.]